RLGIEPEPTTQPPPLLTTSALSLARKLCDCVVPLFFFNVTATTRISTLSLHDALPISRASSTATRSSAYRVKEYPSAPGGDGYSDRKSTRLNSSHVAISYAVFCLKKKSACAIWSDLDGKRRWTASDRALSWRPLHRYIG